MIQKGSLVVNISSEAGSIGASRRRQEYCYCMSKAAMNMGAKILSNELWKRSARVISIHPGWLRTAMGGPDAFANKYSVSPDECGKYSGYCGQYRRVAGGSTVYFAYRRDTALVIRGDFKPEREVG